LVSWLGYGLDSQGIIVDFPERTGDFAPVPWCPSALSNTQPPMQRVPERGEAEIGRGAKMAPLPSGTTVKNQGNRTSTPPCAFMACAGTALPLRVHLLKYSSGYPDVHRIHHASLDNNAYWNRAFVNFRFISEDNIKV
jgi:hypothetical protein